MWFGYSKWMKSNAAWGHLGQQPEGTGPILPTAASLQSLVANAFGWFAQCLLLHNFNFPQIVHKTFGSWFFRKLYPWEQARRYLQNINVYIVTFVEPPYRKNAGLPDLLCCYQKTAEKQNPQTLYILPRHFGHNYLHLVELDWSSIKNDWALNAKAEETHWPKDITF